jgi:phthalate 4,5-dioxygenase
MALSNEKNKILTGVSAGTQLHQPLSRFWYPVSRSEELVDRATKKVTLLGENFVIARKGEELIALEEYCPHRRCSLTLARVEDKGLRCIYHGWLMSPQGKVLESPNEKEEGGRNSIHLRTPKIQEAGGIIWMNICEDDLERAPFPELEWFNLPSSHIVVVNAICKSNWVQSLEGAIDSSHSSHLHSDEIVSKKTAEVSTAQGSGVRLQFTRPSTDKHPKIDVRFTDFGFIYGALRKPTVDPENMVYVRASAYAFPCFVTFPSVDSFGDLQVFTPVDEHHTHFFYVRYSNKEPISEWNLPSWSGMVPGRDIDEFGYMRISMLPNWGQDRKSMANGESFTGLKGVNLQDIVVQESMGAIVDRSKEHLGPADLAIVRFRSLLLDAASQGEQSTKEYAQNFSYASLKAVDGLLKIDQDWTDLYPDGTIQWKSN